jgi:GH15 family glucan-1,4-alpha-glucosidase
MPARIEDYALIGDCETAALVSNIGSIDWLCWPRFDSGACFAALLGSPDNGRWLLAPADDGARSTRRYRGDTMILETEFETDEGAVVIIDFMPLRDERSNIVRTVVGKRGRVAMKTEIVFRFAYGSIVPWVSRLDDGTLRAIAGPDMIVIRSDIELHGAHLTTVGEFAVSEGQEVSFVMTWGPSHLDPPKSVDPKQALRVTEEFWQEWTSVCTYRGDWREPVMRSLLTLKSLTYRPTGGIVAAPTTSLPEELGGVRNWDYRYCWLRDATLTLLSLMDAGYYSEAEQWRDWLLRAAAGSADQVQIMYGIGGERFLREWDIPWLDGYENSKPVRIGNAAHGQLQIDVYGEVMDALHQARLGQIPESVDAWELQKALAAHLEKIWQQPDQGIWETRGDPQHFTHSKVMAWVAFDRAIRAVEMHGLEGPVERWRELRSEIHDEVCRRGFNRTLGSFVRTYGSKDLDASLLFIPLVGFLPIHDARVTGTILAIEKDLFVDGFVLRYDSHKSEDGLPPGEGAFIACSFWLVDAYALQGRVEEARRLFERLLTLCNDVGLLSEEYDPKDRRLIGNFPQAFSHVALVISAFNLSRAEKPADKLAGRGKEVQAAT